MFTIMTRSYIIWHEKIWVKYIVRAFWQMDYNMLTEYWINKDSMLQRNTIGQIIWNQDYYWSSIKMKIVEMVFVRLVDVPHGWRNRGDPNKVNEQDKRLTTHVVFTAANLKTPLTYLSCLVFLLCVRACALCLWVFVCPRKLLKERATNQGVTRPAWWKALSF